VTDPVRTMDTPFTDNFGAAFDVVRHGLSVQSGAP
jgi:hypothetical protein